MPAATFTTSAARAIGNASPGCARSCSITWPASSRGKSRRRNEVPGGKCRWTSGSRQWSGPREQSRSRPLVSRSTSPSSHAGRRERAACLANQLARLPADYREVLVLRNLEGLPFPEVARRMGRSAGAVRILWVRAVDQLRRLLQVEELL